MRGGVPAMDSPYPVRPSRASDPAMALQDTSSQAVRRAFLEFFAQREHRVVASAPVFPQDDPTLLFTNAGMNQFKDVFLGTGSRDYSRAADTQKCIRVQGKHNDLEEVGVDTYHHTFFEMLGNWSFGDYFKEEAITWAWELLTEVLELPKERLWVTVFAGDEKDGLGADEEAERLWRERTDIDPSHVLRFDRRDNFWEMGETGPCGPCTEIHLDRGGPDSNPLDGADPAIGVNAGNERFIELWNLVFMQFNRQDDGSLVELPAKSVDTGMGFERVLGVLQGKHSNYDTDLFQPLFRALEELCEHRYGKGDQGVDIAMRVCADHVRAVTSALSDGALPSNEGRGYVIRRLIRRASRYGLQTLGLQEPFLYRLVPVVAEILGEAFPEMAQRLDHVSLVVRSEEESFRKTLDRGLIQFEKLTKHLSEGATLDGKEAYELYATYGFPQDLVELLARERALVLDTEGWEAARAAHSEISRSEGSFKQLVSPEELASLVPTQSMYHAEGEASLTQETSVVRLLEDRGQGQRLVLASSPFYAEGGGQVGDQGTIEALDGSFLFEVTDTQRVGEVVVHVGKLEGTPPTEGQACSARADAPRRSAVRANHTATHLLHKALRETLGDHVTQQGSYVGPDRLRFDFSHPKGLSDEEVLEVQRRVNAAILGDGAVVSTEESFAAATERGVTALFGEKYGDTVRVVDVDGWSMELCGGTHVSRSGEIGPFVLLSEKAIQAGVRRIEAVTAQAAHGVLENQARLVSDLASLLKAPEGELLDRVAALQAEVKEARKAAKKAARAGAGAAFESVKEQLATAGGVLHGVVRLEGADAEALRDVSSRVKGMAADHAVVLLGQDGDRVPFLVLCGGAALEKGLKAGDLAKGLGKHLGGGGGGRPEAAQGQGMDASGLDAAVAATTETLAAALG